MKKRVEDLKLGDVFWLDGVEHHVVGPPLVQDGEWVDWIVPTWTCDPNAIAKGEGLPVDTSLVQLCGDDVDMAELHDPEHCEACAILGGSGRRLWAIGRPLGRNMLELAIVRDDGKNSMFELAGMKADGKTRAVKLPRSGGRLARVICEAETATFGGQD